MSTLQVQVAVRVFVAMHIPSVTQLAILHTALQSQQEPPSIKKLLEPRRLTLQNELECSGSLTAGMEYLAQRALQCLQD